MFRWFRKPVKPFDPSFDAIAGIMEAYGALLEQYPTAYVDDSLLPVPKNQMRLALQSAWKMAPQLRNAIEVGWTSLHRFQPNVGRTPIDANPDSPAMLDRFIEISKTAEPEMNRDFEEMTTFKRANQR